jgi:hypothetical protein
MPKVPKNLTPPDSNSIAQKIKKVKEIKWVNFPTLYPRKMTPPDSNSITDF